MRTGLDRAELKRSLAGSDPLTVDHFIVLAQALDLDPSGFAQAEPEPEPEPEAPVPIPGRLTVLPAPPPRPQEEDEDLWAPDPDGNLALQTLRMGFGLCVDLFVQLDVRHLRESGIPAEVLSRYPDTLPLRIPAKFHRHHKPRFEEDHFGCTLSFDRLYSCEIPWGAFRQIELTMPETAPPAPPPPPPPTVGRPQLRVVK